MNEQINIFFIILSIVFFLAAVILGTVLYFYGDRNGELESTIKESLRRGELIKIGLDFCIGQSETQLRDFRELQDENKRFGDSERTSRAETERTLKLLREKDREIDRLRKENQKRIGDAEGRCDNIERSLRESQNIIESKTKE